MPGGLTGEEFNAGGVHGHVGRAERGPTDIALASPVGQPPRALQSSASAGDVSTTGGSHRAHQQQRTVNSIAIESGDSCVDGVRGRHRDILSAVNPGVSKEDVRKIPPRDRQSKWVIRQFSRTDPPISAEQGQLDLPRPLAERPKQSVEITGLTCGGLATSYQTSGLWLVNQFRHGKVQYPGQFHQHRQRRQLQATLDLIQVVGRNAGQPGHHRLLLTPLQASPPQPPTQLADSDASSGRPVMARSRSAITDCG